jgi:hypothetical protein
MYNIIGTVLVCLSGAICGITDIRYMIPVVMGEIGIGLVVLQVIEDHT